LLRYFRINDPYRLLGLLGILLVIYLPVFINTPEITYPELKSILLGEKVHEGSSLYIDIVDGTAPLAGWFDSLFYLVFGKSLLARHILVFLIVFIQAVYLGVVFINKKAFSESTFIPALLFVILFSFSYDTIALSGELLGSGFLLLALNNLFKEIEFREQRDESILNLGLFISLASLFSFSFAVYLIAAIVILAIFTRLELRKYLLMILGFLLPHLFLISIYYLRDGLESLWSFYYLPNFNFDSTAYVSVRTLWILGALPVVYLVISLVVLNREARFTKYQSQLVQGMFFWMIFAVLQVLYSKELRPQSFITLIPPLSFYLSHSLLLIRRRRFAEINIWVLLLGIVAINYLSRYGKIQGVSYASLVVPESQQYASFKGKKILVLDDDLAAYKHTTPAPAFLNWKLSKEIFEQPGYYENVVRVYRAFKKDPADIIIDPKNLLRPYLVRIPELQKQYRLTAPGEYHRVVLKKED
jgi:hypothetical protein